jgi:hypothetical protein
LIEWFRTNEPIWEYYLITVEARSDMVFRCWIQLPNNNDAAITSIDQPVANLDLIKMFASGLI